MQVFPRTGGRTMMSRLSRSPIGFTACSMNVSTAKSSRGYTQEQTVDLAVSRG